MKLKTKRDLAFFQVAKPNPDLIAEDDHAWAGKGSGYVFFDKDGVFVTDQYIMVRRDYSTLFLFDVTEKEEDLHGLCVPWDAMDAFAERRVFLTPDRKNFYDDDFDVDIPTTPSPTYRDFLGKMKKLHEVKLGSGGVPLQDVGVKPASIQRIANALGVKTVKLGGLSGTLAILVSPTVPSKGEYGLMMPERK